MYVFRHFVVQHYGLRQKHPVKYVGMWANFKNVRSMAFLTRIRINLGAETMGLPVLKC
jgi:hypothetical protein